MEAGRTIATTGVAGAVPQDCAERSTCTWSHKCSARPWDAHSVTSALARRKQRPKGAERCTSVAQHVPACASQSQLCLSAKPLQQRDYQDGGVRPPQRAAHLGQGSPSTLLPPGLLSSLLR